MATQTSNYNINIERIKLDPIEGFKELSNTFHKNETYGLTELTTRFTIKEGADNDELLMEVFDKLIQRATNFSCNLHNKKVCRRGITITGEGLGNEN